MNAEIICVGNELLSGSVVNTNARYLSQALGGIGVSVMHQTTVADDAKDITKALAVAVGRSKIIIFTGGLGPTKDDLTKETISAALGMKLVEDAQSMQRIEEYFKNRGRTMSENNRKQALVPEGAYIFKNDNGTAPGIGLKSGDQAIVMLPGPPDEMVPMFENSVVPFLLKMSDNAIVTHSVRLFGIGESAAAELINELFDSKNPTVAPYCKPGEVEIRVTGCAKTEAEAEALTGPVINKIRERLSKYIYGIDVESLQQKLVSTLTERGLKIATAESCTAGLLSKKLTEVSGSSAVFDMGIVAYANSVKINALKVPEYIIEKHGAVSPQTAAAMAKGVREISGDDIGVSITGVAGPESSESKPVGLVYIGLCAGETVWVEKLSLGGNDREKIREISAKSVMNMALKYLDNRLSKGVPVGDMFKDGVFDEINCVVRPVKVSRGAVSDTRVLPVLKEAAKPHAPDTDIYSSSPEISSVSSPEPSMSDISSENTGVQTAETPEPAAPKTLDDIRVPMASKEEMQAALDSLTAEPNGDKMKKTPKNKGKKLPWYKRLRNRLFPKKGDKPADVVRKIIFLIALIVLIGSAVYVTNYLVQSYIAKSEIDAVRSLFGDMADDDTITDDGIYKKFQPLLEINNDVVGWVKIDGTQIDNPVLQNTDENKTHEQRNNYYLDRDIYKKWNIHGSLFLDSVSTFTVDQVSQNSVIYGHHMQDGTMFNNLKNYRELDYYKEHPLIQYDTIYRKGEYKIFAVILTNTLPEHDDGYVFNYRMADFESQTVFIDWITECRNRSMIQTSVDVLAGDEILTLSTCEYDFKNWRLVVLARRVREGESSEVNVSSAIRNPNPVYPSIWYTKHSGSKPKLDTPSHDKFDDKESIVIIDTPAQTSSTKTSSRTASKTSSKASGTASRVSGGGTSSVADNSTESIETTVSEDADLTDSTEPEAGDPDTGGEDPGGTDEE